MIRIPSRHSHNPGKGHLFLSPFLILLGIFGFSSSLATERAVTGEGQQKIAVNTNLVLLPVNVTDSRGGFVPSLKREEFRVFEDGQPQNLTVFEERDTPVTIGLIVDHSRSMGGKLADVVAAVKFFVHSSNPQDEMFVVDFNDDVSVELMGGKAFSSDPKDLEPALTAVSARGRTALYDAVSEGLLHLRYGHLEKKALIIISDGGDNASHLKFSQVLAQARQSQALIYAIAILSSDNEEENPGLLKRLCKDTGGIAYFPGPGESVATASREIAQDLREQYMLGYTPQRMNHLDAFRKVEVKVTAPGRGRLRVRTRPGYTLAAEQPPTAEQKPEAR
ncbi:MAG TPA: VWA domain-containing protein [Candidatus Acidoferrum sp.]|nr:VWA domain-containing protein [Candidatus Acidoferrum sp.]